MRHLAEGDLVVVTHNMTGGGAVRRPVTSGEVGLIVAVEESERAAQMREEIAWAAVLLADGLISLPMWSLHRVASR